VRTATTTAGDWQRDGQAWHVAVNVCASTLLDARLAPTVRRALLEADLDPALLTLEVVESRALADLPGVVAQLTALRQIGVRTALDDFGTGFSTLTWLQRLPIDQIKLDRSFVAAADDDPTTPGLIDGVVALARALNLGVVAEGVEHAGQLELLREVGCGLVQGYHLGRPRATPLRAIHGQPPR
jgi:EAL domain-containing protein (putative c-di-GMP-specific phosphodiesterase class I)